MKTLLFFALLLAGCYSAPDAPIVDSDGGASNSDATCHYQADSETMIGEHVIKCSSSAPHIYICGEDFDATANGCKIEADYGHVTPWSLAVFCCEDILQ